MFYRDGAYAGVEDHLQSHREVIGPLSETVNRIEGRCENVSAVRSSVRGEGEILSILIANPFVTYESMLASTCFNSFRCQDF